MISLEEAKSKFRSTINAKHKQTMIYISSEEAKYKKSLLRENEMTKNGKSGKEEKAGEELVL